MISRSTWGFYIFKAAGSEDGGTGFSLCLRKPGENRLHRPLLSKCIGEISLIGTLRERLCS
jgi:hypothetical protein